MTGKVTPASRHALHMLATLDEGAYFVVVMDESMSQSTLVPPATGPRGAAFMVDNRWVVFSPMEQAN